MPSFSNAPIPDLLRDARDLYTNARDDAEVFAILSAEPYLFTTADFDAGLALVQAVTDAQSTEARESLESQQATQAYGAAVQAVERAYAGHRAQGRKVFPRGTPEYGALGLGGDAPDDREDLLRDAGRFYDALAASPDVVAAVRGYSDAVVADAQALVRVATQAGTAQTKEQGDLDRVGVARKDAIRTLRKHAALTASDCAHALADHPQLRERLGLLERS